MSKRITSETKYLTRCGIADDLILSGQLLMFLFILAIQVPASAQTNSADSSAGPVRLARISYVTGTVSYRISEQAEWSSTIRNLPLRQGAEVIASGTGRTEIQFDDGSRLRLGDGAIATLTLMYSDNKGEYTQISLRSGEASLRLMKAPSVYEVDTPTASVDVSGPARVWIDVRSGLRTCVLQGSAVVQGTGGKVRLASRTSIDLASATDQYVSQPLPAPDSFDKWCTHLDVMEDHDLRDPHRTYLPSNVAIMSDNLDDYGYWRTVPKYGRVWHPYHCYAGWRPYHDGHWVWVDPFGWTWVGAEPWGWAPYHYGTWVDEPFGWCWDPGPRVQYWSPAVVDFYSSGLNIAWCPLAPAECVYPAGISIGFGGPNWWLSFGIGGCATWYPGVGGICRPYAWDPIFVNRAGFGGSRFGGWNGVNHNELIASRGYVPINARGVAGASIATTSAFGGRGAYRSLPAGSTSAFTGGRFVGAPARGGSPATGPATVRPTAASATATRSLRADPPASVSRAALSRTVNHIASAAQSPALARQTVAQAASASRVNASRTTQSLGSSIANSAARTDGARSGSNTAASAAASRSASANRARIAANNARSTLGLPRSSGSMLNRGRISSGGSHSTGSVASAKQGSGATARRVATATRSRSTKRNSRAASQRVASQRTAVHSKSMRSSFGGSHARSVSSTITRSQPQRSIGQRSFQRAPGVPQRNFSFGGGRNSSGGSIFGGRNGGASRTSGGARSSADRGGSRRTSRQ